MPTEPPSPSRVAARPRMPIHCPSPRCPARHGAQLCDGGSDRRLRQETAQADQEAGGARQEGVRQETPQAAWRQAGPAAPAAASGSAGLPRPLPLLGGGSKRRLTRACLVSIGSQRRQGGAAARAPPMLRCGYRGGFKTRTDAAPRSAGLGRGARGGAGPAAEGACEQRGCAPRCAPPADASAAAGLLGGDRLALAGPDGVGGLVHSGLARHPACARPTSRQLSHIATEAPPREALPARERALRCAGGQLRLLHRPPHCTPFSASCPCSSLCRPLPAAPHACKLPPPSCQPCRLFLARFLSCLFLISAAMVMNACSTLAALLALVSM